MWKRMHYKLNVLYFSFHYGYDIYYFWRIPFPQTGIQTIAIKQLSHLAYNLVQIFRYLFQMFVQNGSKPSVSNWWKQCQRLTRLCSTVRGITQQSSTHADGPIYICTCPYHCFYGLLLFTCLSLGSQSRWCGNEDRYAVYTDSEGVEFTPRT